MRPGLYFGHVAVRSGARERDAARRGVRAGALAGCAPAYRRSGLRRPRRLADGRRAEAELLPRALRRVAHVRITVLGGDPRQLPPDVVANGRLERVAVHG